MKNKKSTGITEQLDEIAARAEKATAGPWIDHHNVTVAGFHVAQVVDGQAWRGAGPHIAETGWRNKSQEDAAFIAAARSDLPRLVAALRYCITHSNVNFEDLQAVLSEQPTEPPRALD